MPNSIETDFIQITDDNHVRTIRFNRVDKKNALTHDMYSKMANSVTAAQTDPAVRVIVFKGQAGCFTSGNDMVDFQKTAASTAKTGKIRVQGDSPVGNFLRAISTSDKPLVAVVDGMAVGVGVTMLLHCDLVYASKNASFHTPFTALGLVPEAGSSQLMPRMMGHVQAAELLMLSKKITAKTALRLGLITRIFKPKKLDTKAGLEIAALAALPPAAVRASKGLMKRQSEDIPTRIATEGAEFSARLSSEEFTEAASAFMARRKPDFSKFS